MRRQGARVPLASRHRAQLGVHVQIAGVDSLAAPRGIERRIDLPQTQTVIGIDELDSTSTACRPGPSGLVHI